MWGCWASAGYRIEWIMNRLLTSLVLKVSPGTFRGPWVEGAGRGTSAQPHPLCQTKSGAASCCIRRLLWSAALEYIHMHHSEITRHVDAHLPGSTFFTLWPDDSEILTRLTEQMPSLILRFWHSTQSGQMSLRLPLPSARKCQTLANQRSTTVPCTCTDAQMSLSWMWYLYHLNYHVSFSKNVYYALILSLFFQLVCSEESQARWTTRWENNPQTSSFRLLTLAEFGPLCVKTQAWLMIFVFYFLQRNLTHTWPWRCRTLRAQPSLCEAVSHAGSRISCCECCCYLPPLMSPAPFCLTNIFAFFRIISAGISKLKGHLCCTHFRWLIHTYLSSPLSLFALTALSF